MFEVWKPVKGSVFAGICGPKGTFAGIASIILQRKA